MRTAILVGITLFMFALPLRVSAQHDHQGQPPASEQEARQRTAILQEGWRSKSLSRKSQRISRRCKASRTRQRSRPK